MSQTPMVFLLFRIVVNNSAYATEVALTTSLFFHPQWQRIKGSSSEKQAARTAFYGSPLFRQAQQVGIVFEVSAEPVLDADELSWSTLPEEDVLAYLNSATLAWYKHLHSNYTIREGHSEQERKAREMMVSWIAAMNCRLDESDPSAQLIQTMAGYWRVLPSPTVSLPTDPSPFCLKNLFARAFPWLFRGNR